MVHSNAVESEADLRRILKTAFLLQVSRGNSFPYKEQSNKDKNSAAQGLTCRGQDFHEERICRVIIQGEGTLPEYKVFP